ncbi:MAG TPA: DUF3786 domain-containing protein [Candidatus Deferrimicrobiaceae bacterium]|nr:DUF3786 domain-containing protein [Candidatus Deferrimicrobiaceae bacterium]
MIKLDLNGETLTKLQKLTGTSRYEFLGFTIDLKDSTLTDNLSQPEQNLSEWAIQILKVLLSHYASANPIVPTGKLLKFKDVPGGYAYEEAFAKRAIDPVAECFGENPDELPKAAKLLGGTQLEIGDASAQIPALKGILLTYILWGTDEFTASANILYDASASNYLPTEDLAVLGEITTLRLIEAKKLLIEKNKSAL